MGGIWYWKEKLVYNTTNLGQHQHVFGNRANSNSNESQFPEFQKTRGSSPPPQTPTLVVDVLLIGEN